MTAGSGLHVADMALVRTIADLFKIPEQTIQREEFTPFVRDIAIHSTLAAFQAAITDIKVQFFFPIAYSKSDFKLINRLA